MQRNKPSKPKLLLILSVKEEVKDRTGVKSRELMLDAKDYPEIKGTIGFFFGGSIVEF